METHATQERDGRSRPHAHMQSNAIDTIQTKRSSPIDLIDLDDCEPE